MIDAYLRNGELFLMEEGIPRITRDVIEESYLLPVEVMTNRYVSVQDDSEALVLLRKFGFNIAGTTKMILPSLRGEHSGRCSLCRADGPSVENKAFIFPFERKIDSIVKEGNRMIFCEEHAFKLYCAMAYLYTIPVGRTTLRFFFDAPMGQLRRFKRTFKDDFWRERFRVKNTRRGYSLSVSLALSRYHPHEAFFAILHEFVKFLRDRGALNETIGSDTPAVYLIYGAKQFYREERIESTTLEKLIRFLIVLQDGGKELSWGRMRLSRWDSAVKLFYENLEVPRGRDRSTGFIDREEFVRKVLLGTFDFVLLNEIFIERVKRKLPLPPYYYLWARSYLDVFGGDLLNVRAFERINGLGYALGRAMRGSNLERYQWELFRARGFEEFLNKLVELQAKLGTSLDLRPIYENEREWRIVKAVLLNGMLNAIYGGGDEGN